MELVRMLEADHEACGGKAGPLDAIWPHVKVANKEGDLEHACIVCAEEECRNRAVAARNSGHPHNFVNDFLRTVKHYLGNVPLIDTRGYPSRPVGSHPDDIVYFCMAHLTSISSCMYTFSLCFRQLFFIYMPSTPLHDLNCHSTALISDDS
jgi:hypothetical protein